MSLRPEYAELFLRGEKWVEFRRRFSRRHVGATAVFYVSSPARKLAFAAKIARVNHAPVDTLWSDYASAGGVPKETFDSYFDGLQHGYAIEVKNVKPLPRCISLTEAKDKWPAFGPPQSFKALPSGSPLFELLDSSFLEEVSE